jgi:hypothetical protein
MNFSQNQLVMYGMYLLLLVIVLVAEIFHVAPGAQGTTFSYVLVGVLAHFAGNTPATNAIQQNTVATVQNTAATEGVPVVVSPPLTGRGVV